MKTTCLFLLGLAFCWGLFSCTAQQPKPEEVIEIINRVNNYWQETHPQHGRSFWDNAAYHTGNMEVFFLTGNPECYAYSEAWAEHNEWKGAKSDNKEEWKYSYGESDDYVLFGDYQICFQTYADLYTVKPDSGKIARAREVMEYQMSTDEYIDRFQTMAKSVAACQQPEGYWTRSMLDPEHAPGPETSGTAFFTYGLLWGMNNGLLDKAAYQPVVMKAWNYLTTVALQPDGRIGYVQPIGEKAIPGQVVDANSTANFGVGAFLLAACEMVRFLNAD